MGRVGPYLITYRNPYLLYPPLALPKKPLLAHV